MMPYRRSFRRRSRRKTGNSVIHIPAVMDASLAADTSLVIVLASPSLFAGQSASSNIEAQDKDRTVNLGHHVGAFTIDLTLRGAGSSGVMEYCVYKVERAASTPALGTHPVPSTAEVNAAGLQQECRLQNPGKVFHFSKGAYALDQAMTHKIRVSPAKFRLSKMKAGDHWILQLFNRGSQAITHDFECRYKEYE